MIDATVPARPPAPFGDGIADARVIFERTTVPVDPSLSGELWLSNGHYLGDGSTSDDEADTGASGGPGSRSSPAGRPFAPCAATKDPCTARTGFVTRRYDGHFDNGAATPPFDVRWEWSVVGAPPGSKITVRVQAGETLEDSDTPTGLITLVVLLVAGLAALMVVRRVKAPRQIRREPPRFPG